jgi:segregation and condensation protein B
MTPLARQIEALLFLAPEPVALDELADALQAGEEAVREGLSELGEALDGRGVVLREVAGGWVLASHPDAEEAARRLLARPRTPALTAAQAETLAIFGYLQPVSRPEVARIRGVAADSAVASLVERGLIAEAGRESGPGGAVRYKTTPLFERVFGLDSLAALPRLDDLGADAGELRERLLDVASARAS